jgi:ABC-type antimicrobial peptide transport system permease subunit
VYALFASMAAAREREFGLRMALGASRRTIATLVLRQGGASLAIGLLGGAIGALVGTRALRHLLFGTQPFDALALVASAAIITVCATLAMFGPVRRATRSEPIRILR